MSDKCTVCNGLGDATVKDSLTVQTGGEATCEDFSQVRTGATSLTQESHNG